jgi:uncharacterized protein
MRYYRILLSLMVTCALVVVALSTVSGIPRVKSSTKHEDIVRLLEVTEANKIVTQYLDQLTAIIKQSIPDVGDEYLDRFLAEIDVDELLDITITIYDKHLNHDEIRELIKFYESPVGRKLIKVMPVIIEDSIAESQLWSKRIIEKLKRDVEEEN